jgi:ribonuclease HI
MSSGADRAEIRDLLLRYETGLAKRDGAAVDGGLDGLIADDFLEIGSSGRRRTAAEVRALFGGEVLAAVTIDDFSAAVIAPDVVLVTYHIGGPRPSERASIWVHRDRRWTIRFHQGTPGPA